MQRKRVFQYLLEEIPALSIDTGYNTLKLFMERGIVTMNMVEDNENRYDADISLYGHLKCNHCGQIYDIRLPITALELAGLEKFEVTESHMYFKGTCPICLNNRDQQKN
ncbi:MAG: transcriptional repressor [Firmicutes bacterium HGW-Firmicutes-15]|nr:MAG: transcriptional repressor [Firmicutes bacterium HGW-Firmicutes-15]